MAVKAAAVPAVFSRLTAERSYLKRKSVRRVVLELVINILMQRLRIVNLGNRTGHNEHLVVDAMLYFVI